jgi:hypothetical protein
MRGNMQAAAGGITPSISRRNGQSRLGPRAAAYGATPGGSDEAHATTSKDDNEGATGRLAGISPSTSRSSAEKPTTITAAWRPQREERQYRCVRKNGRRRPAPLASQAVGAAMLSARP